jgi:hypothetical protein
VVALLGRPDTWNWLLFFHLLFAFVLVGAVITVMLVSVAARAAAWEAHLPLLRGVAFWTNLGVVLPSFIGLRVVAQALADREFPDGAPTPDWLDLAYPLTDGALVIGGVLLTLLQYWVLRRARAGKTGGWQAVLATVLPPLFLATLVTVIVLMAGKPGS